VEGQRQLLLVCAARGEREAGGDSHGRRVALWLSERGASHTAAPERKVVPRYAVCPLDHNVDPLRPKPVMGSTWLDGSIARVGSWIFYQHATLIVEDGLSLLE
jgi:hypothetical protein